MKVIKQKILNSKKIQIGLNLIVFLVAGIIAVIGVEYWMESTKINLLFNGTQSIFSEIFYLALPFGVIGMTVMAWTYDIFEDMRRNCVLNIKQNLYQK